MNERPWKDESSAPRDRRIFARGNVITHDGAQTDVQPFEGLCEWGVSANEWLDGRRLCIRPFSDSEFRLLDWIECAERAADCPDEETLVTAGVAYWDDEARVADGKAGWFAYLDIMCLPAMHTVSSECKGPFETRARAAAVLSAMIVETTGKARVAA